jgi:ribosomal protein S18 acetylase RimI-like enzyme
MITVRRLQKGDNFQALIVLSRAFFEEYEAHREDFFQIATLNDDGILDYFSGFLEKDDRAAFIALQDDRVVGYITIYIQKQPAHWKIQRIGHISGLMVLKNERRGGIGTKLLEQARAYFKAHGVRYYTVYTAVKNREALAFYEGQGMEPLYSHLVGEIT